MSAPADRLAKLLPLLGSDRDGEALSAARAIGRFLASQGKDWHDLARAAGSMFGQGSASDLGTDWEDFGRRWARADPNYRPEWTEEVRRNADQAWKEYQEQRKEKERERARREFREHEERVKANRAAGREKARQTRARMTPEERETRKEQRRQEEQERRDREEAQERATGAEFLNEANRLRLRETIRWCLDQWGDRPKDPDWVYLANASEDARIGQWRRVSPKRVAEIFERLRPQSKPEKPRRKRRTTTTA